MTVWPELRQFWCCLCFEVYDFSEATFDVDRMELMDVCSDCRMHETYWMIKKLASYE